MRKLLRPSDVLLLGLSGIMDIFEDIKDPLGIMATGSKNLYGWVPERYRKHNFSRVVDRQLRTGDIEKVVKGNQVFLRLTSAGKERIIRDFPMLSMAEKPWDRRWRMVMFDIAEIDKKVRDALRYKLQQLGFGMLQESVWITPYDISMDVREFLEQYDLGDVAFVLEVSDILAGNIDALVKNIWHLDDLANEYTDIIDEATQLQGMYVAIRGRGVQHTGAHTHIQENQKKEGRYDVKNVIGKNDVEKKVREIRERYVAAVLSDPCLPKELLPRDWPGQKARKAVEELKKFM
ncbi:hypothetical protein A3A64_03990 [Candidatus Gottesmanbacteria bacterium RIFCSPLOWO2_01_FULL_48_11]|uniref:Uncharacterized protein n=1 Tax=Candidatus Gottesmanbacteria bacterium RIFCSPLOWO2_01_FULL_48_11 TaxID=1798395 RepID=A0A1F6ATN8_9BACT|nr:MAG: hypothetical protein A3A64_03990 [Candidatus Gottesmanbacteria bacterium RIFCSPLOWO2_01_FULL_48_11]